MNSGRGNAHDGRALAQVKALFQATIDRPSSERGEFLAAAVGGDDALRRDVESLLESDSSDMAFTD